MPYDSNRESLLYEVVICVLCVFSPIISLSLPMSFSSLYMIDDSIALRTIEAVTEFASSDWTERFRQNINELKATSDDKHLYP